MKTSERNLFMSNKNIFSILLAAVFCFSLFLHEDCIGTTYSGSEATLPQELSGIDLTKTDPIAAALILAEGRLKQGLWQEAIQYAQFVISRDKQNHKAHGILGTIYALTGQKKMAEGELTLLKGVSDKDFYAELIKAMLKAQEGKFKEAEEHMGLALKKEPSHPVAIYYSGSLNLAQNNLDKAEKAFKDVIASKPNFSPALAGLGQVYWLRKNTKEAISYYQKAIESDQENLIYRRQLIEIYKLTGQKEAENKAIMESLYYIPGVKEIQSRRGLEFLMEGSYQEAIKLSDKLLGIYKRFPGGYYIKAAAQVNLGKKDDALTNIDAFLKSGFGLPFTHHQAGICYLALGEIEKADEQFKTVIAIDPKSGRSFVPMTIIEQMRGNYDRALQGLQITLTQGEPPSLIHYLRANIFMAKGDKKEYQNEMKEGKEMVPGLKLEIVSFFPTGKEATKLAEDRNLMVIFFLNTWYDKAIQKSDSIIKLYGKDLFAWYYKGLSKMAQKKTKEAINCFNQVVNIAPDLLSAHLALGQVYIQVNDYENALKAFNKVIEINPSYSPAHLALGDVHFQRKEGEKAVQSYRKAIELNPKSPDAYQRLALILAEQPKSHDEAFKMATKSVEFAPKSPFSLDALGWVSVQRGDIKGGLEKLKEASILLPQDPVILYHLGVGHYKNNNPNEAKNALQAALNISKNFRGADQAIEILKKLSK
jgi:tetratricopeptide (TPR) repeat protein